MTDYTTMTNDELSAEVARRLFGLVPHPSPLMPTWFEVPDVGFVDAIFASDHNAALGLVVPEMRKRGYRFEMEDDWDFGDGEVMRVGIRFRTMKQARVEMVFIPFGQEPRAICLAALAALDAEEAK